VPELPKEGKLIEVIHKPQIPVPQASKAENPVRMSREKGASNAQK
jgi:hypothetical protein